MQDILINGKKINITSSIFLIAEAGVNHNGSITLAKKLIDLAAKAKIDAIKFQTFVTEDDLLKNTPKVAYQITSTKVTENFFDMVKKYEFNKEEFQELKEYCNIKNIIFLSTAFDHTSVDWLDYLKIPAYKIGSGELTNYPLIKYICSKGKPILLSTGMATIKEVKEVINFIKLNGISQIAVLQCTTNYPADYKEINLNVIDTYKKEFPDLIIGFSDHSLGIIASIGAATKGVKIIEKHFTLDKEMEGPDHKASLDPEELFQWVKAIRNIEKALGDHEKYPSKNELEIAKIARKSIVTIKDLKAGDIITDKDIYVKRPGFGISPIFFEQIIGKKLKKNIQKDIMINWEDFE